MCQPMLAVLLSAALFLGLPQQGRAAAPPVVPEIVLGSDYLHYHPDLRHRLRGLRLEQDGRPESALEAFLEAARYADKPSQARIAEMLWEGEGAPRDRARAYAWMDLAAERGYRLFVAFRERYWEALDARERAEALRVGADIYAEYGDAVAQERMEHMLRKRRMKFTGSRVGWVSHDLLVYVPGPAGFRSMPRDLAYQPRFWQSEHYWEWQDEQWQAPPTGLVEVDPLRPEHGRGTGE